MVKRDKKPPTETNDSETNSPAKDHNESVER